MIDICNGVRPKVPDFMLNWIPEWYLDLMYRCWSDDPSKRPTCVELVNFFFDVIRKLEDNLMDNDVMRQLKIADENQKIHKNIKSKNCLNYIHIQVSYILNVRYIYTLHGLHDLLEIKSGKSSGIFLEKILKILFNK